MKTSLGATTCNACGAALSSSDNFITGMDRLHSIPGTCAVVICESCGSGTTTPLVRAEALYSLYPTDYNAYSLPDSRVLAAAATGLFHWRYSRALRRHPLRSADRRFHRILDVGGGRGDLATMLSRHGADVTVLDPSDAACRSARSRGLHAIEGTLETLSLQPNKRYDALIFQHSLEHVASPNETLVAARGLLSQGGSLLITLPNFGSQQSRRFGSYWFHLDLPRHRTHFTQTGLERALEHAGFRQCEFSTSTSPDGFAMSEYYRRHGGAPRSTVRRLMTAGSGIAVSPLVSALTGDGDGDTLHASCQLDS